MGVCLHELVTFFSARSVIDATSPDFLLPDGGFKRDVKCDSIESRSMFSVCREFMMI